MSAANREETPKQAARRLFGYFITQGYRPAGLHVYQDAKGVEVYCKARLDPPVGTNKKKEVRPFHKNGSGYQIGEPAWGDQLKPLWNLPRIMAADPSVPIWYVEGEECANALGGRNLLATTAGSASSDDRADFSPLAGRRVILWPDNDQPGRGHVQRVAGTLRTLGCTVEVVDVDRLSLPEHGDVVDYLAAHPDATAADLEALESVSVAKQEPNSAADFSATAPWPGAMDDAALHGIAGDFVRMVAPDSEADPAAILVQFLVAFGALVGRGPNYQVESDQHHSNLFALLIGNTAKGRKGTSFGRVRQTFEQVANWKPHVSGLSSGEGIKYHVRDAREETKRTKKRGITEIVDEGVLDKRLLAVEAEFASVLRAVQRQGSTLSATIREAWDTGDLRTLTKNDPITASGAHICIIGHITAEELRAELTATDTANGFANRFLFAAVKRSRLLPFGGNKADPIRIRGFADRLGKLAEQARTRSQMAMTENARTMWAKVYPMLSADRGGLYGAVTARAEAQAVRLALVFALLDGSDQIDAPHLLASLAVWQYCDATARHIFGTSLGDRVADEILRALERAGTAGLTRTDIRDLFDRNVAADRIGTALELLRSRGRASVERIHGSGGGRPPEVWKAAK